MTRDLRFGSITADPDAFDSLVVTEFERNGQSQTVGYDASSGRLESVEFIEVDGSLSTIRRELVAEIDNSSQPVFTYLERDGQPIPCGEGEDCAAAYSSASQIRITLVRTIDGREPVVVANQVGIRSLRYRSITP